MSNFERAGTGTGWSNGVAFCPRLPTVLAASGVDLPHERAEQRKSQNAESEKTASGRWPARMAPIAIFGFFTLSALAVFRRLVKGKDLATDTLRSSNPKLNLLTTIGGLAMVSVIAAGCGLRVMYALFDWPDPTNTAAIIGVWLLLLAGGTALVLRRHPKG